MLSSAQMRQPGGSLRLEILVAAAIVGLAAILLFWDLTAKDLWQDEAATAVLATRMLKFGRPLAYDGVNLLTIDMQDEDDDATPEPARQGSPGRHRLLRRAGRFQARYHLEMAALGPVRHRRGKHRAARPDHPRGAPPLRPGGAGHRSAALLPGAQTSRQFLRGGARHPSAGVEHLLDFARAPVPLLFRLQPLSGAHPAGLCALAVGRPQPGGVHRRGVVLVPGGLRHGAAGAGRAVPGSAAGRPARALAHREGRRDSGGHALAVRVLLRFVAPRLGCR